MTRITTIALAGRYRLDRLIAAGGVGEVRQGRDAVLHRTVAVKLLRPEYSEHRETLARFRDEARHAAGISHPGIAQVYGYGEDPQPFLVMELVNGPSLAALLARGPLDPWTTMHVAAQAAAALSAAHGAGLVHRDIKPGNLLIAPGMRVKITDFGIAYAAGSAPLTSTGTLIGTPSYLAPEGVAGRSATPASDLYSLGIVCYECLTGAPPFTGTPVEIALAHSRGSLPALPPNAPAEVAALLTSLAAKDPQDRPPTAANAAARAVLVRNAQPRGAAAAGIDADTSALAALADTPPPTRISGLSGAPVAGPPDGRPFRFLPPPRQGDVNRHFRGLTLGVAAGAAAITVALSGWLSSPAPSAAQHPRHQHRRAQASASPAPRLVTVSQAGLVGQRGSRRRGVIR